MSPNDNEQETAILLMPPDEGQAEIDPLRKVMVAPAPPLALLKRQHHEGNNKSNLFSDVSLKARGMEPGFSPEFIEDFFDGLCVGAIVEFSCIQTARATLRSMLRRRGSSTALSAMSLFFDRRTFYMAGLIIWPVFDMYLVPSVG